MKRIKSSFRQSLKPRLASCLDIIGALASRWDRQQVKLEDAGSVATRKHLIRRPTCLNTSENRTRSVYSLILAFECLFPILVLCPVSARQLGTAHS
jgi:hypothetical protein